MNDLNEQPKYPHTPEDEEFNRLMEEREREDMANAEASREVGAQVPAELAQAALQPTIEAPPASQPDTARQLERQ